MFTCKQNQMERGKSKMIVVRTETNSRNSQTPIFLGFTPVDEQNYIFLFCFNSALQNTPIFLKIHALYDIFDYSK